MWNSILTVTALLSLLGAGWGVVHLLGRREESFLLERLALAWLFGCAAISLLLFVFGFFLHGVWLTAAVTAICIASAALPLLQTAPATSSRVKRSHRPGEIILLVVIAVEFVVVSVASYRHSLGWDGLLNWEIKARYAFLSGGHLPVTYYTDTSRAFSHPEYPLCLPFCELWLYLWIGQPSQLWAKAIFPFFFLAAVILLAATITRCTGRGAIGLVVASLLFLDRYLLSGAGGMLVGYADLPLAAYYLAAIGYLISFAGTHSVFAFRVFALAASVLPWVKREGNLLWITAAIVGFIVSKRSRTTLRTLLWLLPGGVILCGWRVYLVFAGAVPSHDFVPLSDATSELIWQRLPHVASAILSELILVPEWTVLWLLAAACLLYLAVRTERASPLLLAAAIAVPFGVYCSSYVLSAWPDYTQHVRTSFPRLIVHLLPLGWLAIGLGCAASLRERESKVVSPAASGSACRQKE